MSIDYKTIYTEIFPTLSQIAKEIEADICDCIKDFPRVDRISARAKTPPKFIKKSEKFTEDGSKRYNDPLTEVQDQIGARIITFYLDDVSVIDQLIMDNYSEIESFYNKPKSIKEFSYEAKHYVLFVPDEIYLKYKHIEHVPKFFELQIKTLFQHAWAEAEHDINYKTSRPLSNDDKKLLYFSAAQAWGADKAFNAVLQKCK